MAIEAVLFDLDDTLSQRIAPRDWDVVTAWQVEALTPHFARLGAGHIDLDSFVRRFWTTVAATYPDPDTDPAAPLEERRWQDGPTTLRQSLVEAGVDGTAGDVTCLWEALHSVPPAARNHHLYSDAVPTLSALHAAGYRLAVVTARPTSAAVVARELQQQGMPDLFSVVVTSGDEGYRKPHARIFQAALQQLGLQPGQAVMVGVADHSNLPGSGRF